MESPQSDSARSDSAGTSAIRVLQPAQSQHSIVRHALPDASADEVTASTCSCVVHLCGCS